jgi:hypothetical protein
VCVVRYVCRHICDLHRHLGSTTHTKQCVGHRRTSQCCYVAPLANLAGHNLQRAVDCPSLLATQHTSQVLTSTTPMPDLQLLASQALHANVKSVSSSQVARLWAGYGTVTAVQAVTDTPAGGAAAGGAAVHHLIVKQVRAWM